MKATRNPHNLQVGQTLYYVANDRRDAHRDGGAEITKIGRQWATVCIAYCNARVDLETLEVDGGNYSSPGRCYLSREAWELERKTERALDDFKVEVARLYATDITLEQIDQARRVLGGEVKNQ